jgi:hypothetical protein
MSESLLGFVKFHHQSRIIFYKSKNIQGYFLFDLMVPTEIELTRLCDTHTELL